MVDTEKLSKLEEAVKGVSVLYLIAICIFKPKDKNYMLPNWAIKHNKKIFKRYGHGKISYEELNFNLVKPFTRYIIQI